MPCPLDETTCASVTKRAGLEQVPHGGYLFTFDLGHGHFESLKVLILFECYIPDTDHRVR